MEEEEYRAPMRWDREDDELFSFYKKAISLRREHTALRQGDFRTLYAGRGNGLYLYTRSTDSDTILIAMNVSETAARLPNRSYAGQAAMSAGQILWQNGLCDGALAPMGWAVFRAMSGPNA